MKHNIQKKILFWTILIVTTIGALVSILVYLRLENILMQSEKKSIHSTTHKKAREIQLILDNTALFVKMLATRVRILDYLNNPSPLLKKELVDLFDSYQRDNINYLSIYLLDATGSAHISTDRSFIGNSYSFRPYFIEAMKGNSYVEAALGKTTNTIGFYFSYPVTANDGKRVGVVAVKLEPKSVYIRALGTPLDGERVSTDMITDTKGVILFSTKKDRLLKSMGKLSPRQLNQIYTNNTYLKTAITPLWYDAAQTIISSSASIQTVEIVDKVDKEKELLSISKVSNYPFYLVSEVGLDSILGQISAITFVIGIGIFSAALLSLLIISYRIRSVLSPLTQLKKHSELLSRGDFSKKLDIQSGDEFEEVASILNRMQDFLQNSYKGLQSKVDERTKELNQHLAEIDLSKKAMFNILEDVSRQKEKIEHHAVELQKFQLAVENAHDHIVITDPNGVVLFANKAVESITGFTREEIFAKKAGSKKLWGGHMGKEVYELFWKTIKIDKKVFIGEFFNKRKNGDNYIAESQVSPILDAHGEVIYFVGIERDITKAKQVDKMKTEFISLASHQLRTPLSAMKWFLEMLLNGDAGKLTGEQTEFINNVEQSNNRMIELVNSLLNVSRIESGRIIIEPIPTNLAVLVEEVKKEMIPKLTQKKQKLIVTIHNDLPLISLDQKLMRQVYANLISNAIKYSPDESEIVVIISKENDTIITQVSDNGCGIPLGEQSLIFSKFYRATNAIKKETEGNGLGLYLVKSIIDSSGGKVWFTSKEGEGTSFFFQTPLVGMTQKAGEVHMS